MVATLGFEMPTPDDLATWADSGKAWVAARADEWSAWMQADDATRCDLSARPCRTTPAADPGDTEFAAMVAEMVETFGADEALAASAPATPAPAFEPLGVPEDLYEGLTYALNREAEGLSVAAPDAPTAATSPEEPLLPTREQRLARALELTGQALGAWARLLSGSTVVAARP
jgi:hypothetical protein